MCIIFGLITKPNYIDIVFPIYFEYHNSTKMIQHRTDKQQFLKSCTSIAGDKYLFRKKQHQLTSTPTQHREILLHGNPTMQQVEKRLATRWEHFGSMNGSHIRAHTFVFRERRRNNTFRRFALFWYYSRRKPSTYASKTG